ncbi:hypothetical protein KP509_01G049600 [Ceratopteris richardii]|nr:hypothetical protein KP509_01G049600 [Ceratopteris richardii]
MNEVTPPWMVLSVGAALNLFGYLMIWLSVTHRVAVPSAGAVSFYMFAAANSQTFVNTAVLVACVKNFPLSRGIVLGLTKGCIGLSGAVFVQIYHAIYGQDTTDMILFLAWLPSLIILLFMFFIRRMDIDLKENHDRHFFFLLYLALALAGFLTVAIILENALSQLPTQAYKAFGAVAVVFVAANALVAIRAECERRTTSQNNVNVEALESEKPPNCMALTAPTCMHSEEDMNRESTMRSTVSDGDKKEAQMQSCSASNEVGERKSSGESVGEQDGTERNKGSSCAAGSYDEKECHRSASSSQVKMRCGESGRGSSMGCVSRVRAYFKQWPERGEDHSIPQALLSLDMWILFVSVTCGVGGSLAAVDNMGQIGESLGYSKVSISTCVSLISIWNFLGRVAAGFGSEHLLRRYGVSRALVLSFILGFSSVGHLLIAFPGPGTLYAASILVGFCFGAMWPPLYAVISEIFGLKYFATLYNVVGSVSPLGSYLLNVKVAGHLYDHEARRQAEKLLLMAASTPSMAPSSKSPSIAPPDFTCYGTHCFRMAFSIIAIASFAGCLISLLLVIRTRKFYSQNIYAKLHAPQQQHHPHQYA